LVLNSAIEVLFGVMQNRRQKVFNRGALHLCRGTWHWKFDKNSTDLYCFIFQFGEIVASLGGLSLPKPPPVATVLLLRSCTVSDSAFFKGIYATHPKKNALSRLSRQKQ